jgi:hypothetical protein
MNSRWWWQRSTNSLARLCATGAAVAVAVTSTSAHADSAYCRKVRARAAADAALLVAPKLLVEGIKAPSPLQAGGKLDPASPNSGYQIRAGATFSPLNLYKGLRVKEVGEADCEQHDSAMTAQLLLIHAPDLGRLAALREQAGYLDGQKGKWESISSRMGERFAARTVTLFELEEARKASAALARQRSMIGAEIGRLEAIGLEDYRGSIPELIRRIHDKAMVFEREASHVRSLDSWVFNITGGYMPPIYGAGSSDVFGVVQVGYSLGGPWHDSNESRYLGAREEELQKERTELGRQLDVLRANVKVTAGEAGRELEITEKRVKELTELRALLEKSEVPNAAQSLDHVELELIAAQADRVFLTGLIRELSRLEVN